MKVIAYPTTTNPPKLVPASSRREWMDVAANKNPYRCLPLSMANSWGWQLLSTSHFIAEWNGGRTAGDIQITHLDGSDHPVTHFGEGTLTWHLGYVFKTEYPYGMYMTGAPNEPSPNIIPLSGLVETHWLPYTSTMNWRFTQPGKFEMKIGQPFCQLYPVDMRLFEDMEEPEIRSMSEVEAKEFHDLYWEWNISRTEFMSEQRQRVTYDPSIWQKNYFQGVHPPDGKRKCPVHTTADGEVESTHRTKPNVPNFVNKDEIGFKTPSVYWERIKEIQEKERQHGIKKMEAEQRERAIRTPTPSQVAPINVSGVDFNTKIELFKQHLTSTIGLTVNVKPATKRKRKVKTKK